MNHQIRSSQIGLALRVVLLALLLALSIGLLLNRDWIGGLFDDGRPRVLQDGPPEKKLVEPPPAVLNLQDSFANVAEAVEPAVVNISAVQISKMQTPDVHEFFFGDPQEFFERFFGEKPAPRRAPEEFRMEGTGSGVIIDPEGFILTNNHVVQNADQLTVTLSSGKSYKGRAIGSDPHTDLAIIRIKGANPFPYAPLGDSSVLRVGDWVLAIGSPFGLEQTVTAGIVSAIRQTLFIEGRNFRGLIQTDAAINRGNSGGPLVNLRGEVVGVNVAIFAPTGVFSGVGFAIPVNRVKTILSDLIEKGFVERSWMGIEIVEVDEVVARQFGLDAPGGALVNNVIPDSPAARAGIQRGDIVLSFNNEKIEGVGQLQDIVARTEPGAKVPVAVLREGKRKRLSLETAVMPRHIATGEREAEPEEEAEPQTGEWLGATFSQLTDELRQRYSIGADVASGVAVVNVPPDSVAADAGLAEGDVIGSINRTPVPSIAELTKVSKEVDPKEGLVFDVYRRGRWLYLSYKALR